MRISPSWPETFRLTRPLRPSTRPYSTGRTYFPWAAKPHCCWGGLPFPPPLRWGPSGSGGRESFPLREIARDPFLVCLQPFCGSFQALERPGSHCLVFHGMRSEEIPELLFLHHVGVYESLYDMEEHRDRKSTRLNSSHSSISYA